MSENIDIFEINKRSGGYSLQHEPYRKVFGAYIDIIGYKNLLVRYGDTAPEKVLIMLHCCIELAKVYKCIKINMISDAISLTTTGDHPAEFINLIEVVKQIINSLLKEGLLCRGGIALGNHSSVDPFLISPVLIRAYELEQAADLPRVIVDEDLVETIVSSTRKEENSTLHYIMYHNTKRYFSNDYLSKDNDGYKVLNLYSGEPMYYLVHGVYSSHWPKDSEPSEEILVYSYKRAQEELIIIRNIILSNLKIVYQNIKHRKKWFYKVRKFNDFIVTAKFLKNKDRFNLYIKTKVIKHFKVTVDI